MPNKAGKEKNMETLRLDLINVGYAYVVFALAYTANILFSLYYNIKMGGYDFNKYMLWDSIKKAAVFVLATFALVVAVDAAMIYLAEYAPQISAEAKDTVTIIMVISTIGRAALKYIIEAYNTFANILNGKPSEVAAALDTKE